MTLIVFDCDGTIVDSQAGIVLSMEHAFKALRMTPPTRERVLSVVGLSLREAFSVLAPEAEHGTRDELAERYKSAFRELDRDPSEQDILFPGAKPVIQALAARQGLTLGIATGKSRRGVDRLIDREQWHGYFSTIQTADDHPSKPHPSMILRAMAETGCSPEATVMVGDTTYDIQMARAAGVGAIGVSWGYHAASELRQAGAHVVLDEYELLPEAVTMVLRKLGQAA